MAASALMRFFLLFREVLRVFLPFAFHICFAGYLLLTGFSRYLIWIEVASSEKKPELIEKLYLGPVKKMVQHLD